MATFIAPEAKTIRPVEGSWATPPHFLAEHLARVFGTEEDPVNCSFFFKVGACRNGDRCGKKHNHPSSSQTLLMTGLYPGTAEGIVIANEQQWTDDMYDLAQAHLEAFYEEVVLVLAEYGELEEVVVVDNTIDYMLGNVYARYRYEECATMAMRGLTGRYYFGKLISAEYSPVADFREARCRAHHETRCSRVGACRFLHIKHVPRAIKRRVFRQMYKEHPEFNQRGEYDPTVRAMNRMNLEDRPDKPVIKQKGGDRPHRQMALGDAPPAGRRRPGDDEFVEQQTRRRQKIGEVLDDDVFEQRFGRRAMNEIDPSIYDNLVPVDENGQAQMDPYGGTKPLRQRRTRQLRAEQAAIDQGLESEPDSEEL